jgi:glutamyl-tRNA synthetase
LDLGSLKFQVRHVLGDAIINVEDPYLEKVIELVRDRCHLLTDFVPQSSFFFKAPEQWDIDAVKPKWNTQKQDFFRQLIRNFEDTNEWSAPVLESNFQTTAVANQLKSGELLLPFRIMLVGGKFGPAVFEIAALLGKKESLSRISRFLDVI